MIELSLPLPPTTNHAYVTVAGRRVLSSEAKQYKQMVAYMCRKQLGSYEPMTGRLDVSLHISFCNNHKCDLGNREKIAVDALVNARLIQDDSQIDRLVLTRGPVTDEGSLTITISEIAKATT
jgi:crossover junction endodeoxyribonuclease RusA